MQNTVRNKNLFNLLCRRPALKVSPYLFLLYKVRGKALLAKRAECIISFSLFLSKVPVHTEVAVTDYTLVNTIKSMAKVFDPQKLAHLISSQKGGLIASGADGIWMCPEFKNTLLVCKSSFEGKFLLGTYVYLRHNFIWTGYFGLVFKI